MRGRIPTTCHSPAKTVEPEVFIVEHGFLMAGYHLAPSLKEAQAKLRQTERLATEEMNEAKRAHQQPFILLKVSVLELPIAPQD
jgi:hypothetical protein